MIKLQALSVTILLVFISITYSDTAEIYHAKWDIMRGNGNAISRNTNQAMRGSEEIIMTAGSWQSAFSRLPFINSQWHRFYLKFKLPDDNAEFKKSGKSINFLNVNFSDRARKDRPLWIWSYALTHSGLMVKTRPSLDTTTHITFMTTANELTEYYIENHFAFKNPDSIVITGYINGDSAYQFRIGYYDSKSLLEAGIEAPNSLFRGCSIHLDEWALSNRRLPPIPPNPSEPKVFIDSCTATFTTAPYSTYCKDERHTSTRWKLFRKDEASNKPLYDVEDLEPSRFFRRTVPFFLDSGEYSWQVAYKNNSDELGAPSTPAAFSITHKQKLDITLNNVYLTKLDCKDKINTIVPGGEYQLHFDITPHRGWDDAGYILASLSSDKYTYGHPQNNFGVYLSKSNYILNISFEGTAVTDTTIGLYEKQENTAISGRVLKGGAPAQYTLPKILLDTLSGHVAIGFKLSEAIDTGNWTITAFAASTNGKTRSNIVRSNVRTEPTLTGSSSYYTILLISLIFITLAVIILKKRSKSTTLSKTEDSCEMASTKKPAITDPEMIAIMNYLEMHIAEEISTEKLLKDLRYSSYKFYKILKKHKINSLPKLLNSVRIEKAKELLKGSNKSIAEIGFETGFGEARYFNKVFKDHTSTTPGEYRKNLNFGTISE